jgi:hypothetical protein
MPAEAARLQHRVGARDRRFFAALALLGAAGTTAGVLFFAHGGSGASSSRCLAYDAAGVMGGGTWHVCGSDATAFCRTHAGESRRLDARCAKLVL